MTDRQEFFSAGYAQGEFWIMVAEFLAGSFAYAVAK